METGNVRFNSMTERTEDMKVQKGEFGYIRWQKKRRILVTLGLFLLPLAAFIAGVLVTGTRNNLITVIAVVGCLPACRSMVGVIMMWDKVKRLRLDPSAYANFAAADELA